MYIISIIGKLESLGFDKLPFWGKNHILLRKVSPFLISFLITLIVTFVIIRAREYNPIDGANALPLPGNCRLLILSPELQFVTTYVFECAGKFSTRIYPLPIENPWNEELYKDKKWYKDWWKYHELPQQARKLDRDCNGVGCQV